MDTPMTSPGCNTALVRADDPQTMLNTIQQQAERIRELEAIADDVANLYATLAKHWPGTINELLEAYQAQSQQLAEVVEYATKQNATIKYLQNEFSTAGGGAVVYTHEMRKRAIKDALALPLPKAMQP